MKSAFGLSLPENLEDVCTPQRCALIVYDMQAAIVPQIAEGAEILARCQELLAAAREGGFRIFFTRHFFLPNQAAGTGQLRRAMVWQRKDDPMATKPFIAQGSAGWEIVPELAPREGEVVLDKITMSAFEGTFLNLAMRDAHLEAFLIAGIALEVGIEPTLRHAADLGFVPVLVADACGSGHAEAGRRSLDALVFAGDTIVTTIEELRRLLPA